MGEPSNFFSLVKVVGKFLLKLTKTKFAMELFINVMKHTIHKWGAISSIHGVIVNIND